MMKPPSPPAEAQEYLSQLKHYYRQLVEYHQQAAMVAAQHLSHIEALLSNELSFPEVVETRSWLLNESSKPVSYEEPEDKNPGDNDQPMNISLPSLKALLEAEQGKILHIDYIVRRFDRPNQDLSQLKSIIEQQLEIGAKLEMWTSVPDAPECWTLSLLDIPGLVPNKKETSYTDEISLDALPTKKVANLLSAPVSFVLSARIKYEEHFTKGVDYFQNSQKSYYWSSTGIDKLKKIRENLLKK